ncbi:hypothetical protein [Plasmodium yoelii yoelii]|uniref:Uncharacterized protein n=1 Tax=Plasmodium yoelii yoelii TaxID=73239 RepID=Q7RDW6_PLAYO|nr:hypothetical protein [Plasmodium yoelii yoelii]
MIKNRGENRGEKVIKNSEKLLVLGAIKNGTFPNTLSNRYIISLQ